MNRPMRFLLGLLCVQLVACGSQATQGESGGAEGKGDSPEEAGEASLETYGDAVCARLLEVYDGDTFYCDIEGWPAVVGSNIAIRVYGIDTPELRGSGDVEHALGLQAKAIATTLLEEAEIIELRALRRGKYFRLVADVYADGSNLADILIAHNLAYPYFGGTKQTWPLEDAAPMCDDTSEIRPVRLPEPGDLVITEVYANPPGADSGEREWVEIFAVADVDLNGLILYNASTRGTAARQQTVSGPWCLPVEAGLHFVLGGSHDRDLNGSVPVDFAFADGLSLYNLEASLKLVAHGVVVDEAVCPSSPSGAALQINGLFCSSANANDYSEDWCEAETSDYFDELGSPGAQNPECQ